MGYKVNNQHFSDVENRVRYCNSPAVKPVKFLNNLSTNIVILCEYKATLRTREVHEFATAVGVKPAKFLGNISTNIVIRVLNH